jgi:hypothetical protein
MREVYKTIPWLDALAFAALALGVVGLLFFWMPRVGVCLSSLGLVIGFFGWVTASQYEDSIAFYLMVGSIVSTAVLLLNLALVTRMILPF